MVFALLDVLRVAANAAVMPPTSLFALMALGWLGARLFGTKRPRLRRLSRATAWGSAGVLALLSVPMVSFWLLDSLQTAEPIGPDVTAIDAQVIVVLSGDVTCDPPEYGPDQPGALSLVRCRYGAALSKRTGLPILVSGGVLRPDRRPVSHVLRDFIQDELGTPVAWTEDVSVNTRQNARGTAEVLRPLGLRRVALVTHAWHMPRAREAFERAGLEVLPAPTAASSRPATLRGALVPRMRAFRDSGWAIHEWIGRVWYVLT